MRSSSAIMPSGRGRVDDSMAIPKNRATRADLARTEGRAELIDGRIVCLPPFVYRVGCIVGNLTSCLFEHERQVGGGELGTATLGYVVPRLPSGRESFCACASWYSGPLPENPMSFIEGPPTFAVEVRDGEEDTAKRDDYFEAGTLVVWDVDPVAETIACYRPGDPNPVIFRRGDVANAEPAVPGWQMPVDEVFA
jgi:Uma2 family endonuclease